MSSDKPAVSDSFVTNEITSTLPPVRMKVDEDAGGDSVQGAKPPVRDMHVDYAERKIRDAYSSVPYVRSVSYRRRTDRWVLVIVHENPAKGEAHLALIGKLCDISRDDALMPVFEPWIIHVSDAGASFPEVEKHIISR